MIDEVSHNLVNYVSAASAGFYKDLTSFTLDARRGDLWVVSVNEGGESGAASALHKLQLVSGRGLLEARTPPAVSPVRFVDVTVAPDGTVYALDAVESRIFRLRPGARALELVMRLQAPQPTALTAVDDRVLYVAAEKGLVRVDLGARSAAPVKSVEELTRFESLSWRAGSLVGVQRVAESFLIVRIVLDAAGTRAQPRHVLAASPVATVGALVRQAFHPCAVHLQPQRAELRRHEETRVVHLQQTEARAQYIQQEDEPDHLQQSVLIADCFPGPEDRRRDRGLEHALRESGRQLRRRPQQVGDHDGQCTNQERRGDWRLELWHSPDVRQRHQRARDVGQRADDRAERLSPWHEEQSAPQELRRDENFERVPAIRLELTR